MRKILMITVLGLAMAALACGEYGEYNGISPEDPNAETETAPNTGQLPDDRQTRSEDQAQREQQQRESQAQQPETQRPGIQQPQAQQPQAQRPQAQQDRPAQQPYQSQQDRQTQQQRQQPDDGELQQGQRELPRTASGMPLIGLLGALAVAGAIGLRVVSRQIF